MRASGDEHELRDPRLHQRLDRVADHGTVVDREQMLVRDACERMQASASPAGEDDALHGRPSLVCPRVRVLFFGTYDSARHPRVLVLAEGMAAHGDEVSEINAPLGLDTSWRVRILKQPWLLPVLGARMLSAWTRLWRRARRAGSPDAVVIGYMGHFDVHLARRLWPDVP